MSAIRYQSVTAPVEQNVEVAIKALWARNGAYIEDPLKRLSEVRQLAWLNDEVVGVSTASVVREPVTQQALISVRALTDASARSDMVATSLVLAVAEEVFAAQAGGQLLPYVGGVLQMENALLNGDERPLRAQTQNLRRHWDSFWEGFFTAGFDGAGRRSVVAYFPGAEVQVPGSEAVSSLPVDDGDAPKVAMNFLADGPDESLRQEIADFWSRMGVLTAPQERQGRLPKVRCIVRRGTDIVGTASLSEEPFGEARTRIWQLRMLLTDDADHRHIRNEIIRRAYGHYNDVWRAGSGEGAPVGMCYWVDRAHLLGPELQGKHPDTGFWACGFDQRQNLRRLQWFDEATLGDLRKAGGW